MKKMLLALGVLVFVLVFGRSAVAQEELDLMKLRQLAKKLEAPIVSHDERAEKQTIDEFKMLTPREVFELRKIQRQKYWPQYFRAMNK